MKPVAPVLLECPKSNQAFHEILAMQWGFMYEGSKTTDDRREFLSDYSGAWVGISGVITYAKIIIGVLRISSMTTNFQSAKGFFSRLDKDSRHLDSVVDSGTLSGAVYKAGQTMFQTYAYASN